MRLTQTIRRPVAVLAGTAAVATVGYAAPADAYQVTFGPQSCFGYAGHNQHDDPGTNFQAWTESLAQCFSPNVRVECVTNGTTYSLTDTDRYVIRNCINRDFKNTKHTIYDYAPQSYSVELT